MTIKDRVVTRLTNSYSYDNRCILKNNASPDLIGTSKISLIVSNKTLVISRNVANGVWENVWSNIYSVLHREHTITKIQKILIFKELISIL